MKAHFVVSARILAGAAVAFIALPFWLAEMACLGIASALAFIRAPVLSAANWVMGE